jgi:hypothetical protein
MSSLFNISPSLLEAIKEVQKEENEFQAKVRAHMAKKGIKSLGELTPEQKKKFFKEVDALHQAKNEEVDLEEESGGGTSVSSTKNIAAQKKRAAISQKIADTKEKHAKEMDALRSQKSNVKEEFDDSFLEEAFSPAMVAKLKAEYGKISGIDPSSDSYKKLIAMLDKMDKKDLQTLADAGIKFVSGLARNRVNRMKNEEVVVDEATGVTDYNAKSQGGTRKELLAKYHKTKSPKDAEAARKAGATQKELQGEEVEINEMDKSQPSSSRGAEGLPVGKEAKPVSYDKVKKSAYGTLKKALNKKYKKVEEEVELDEAKKPVSKEDVTKLLIKYGNNPQSAKKMVDAEFASAVKRHPEASASKIAEVIRSVAEEVEIIESDDLGPVKEIELEEGKSSTGYNLYHKDFSSAMAHAYDFAKNKYGIEVDPEEIDRKVAMGPKKPSSGKTNAYRLLDKTGKKAIQVQVANLDNKRYELNMYSEEVQLDEVKIGDKVSFDHEMSSAPGKKVKKSGTVHKIEGDVAHIKVKDKYGAVTHKKKVGELQNEEIDIEELDERVIKGKGYDNPENERKAPEGKVPTTSLMPGHNDKAARFAAIQAKGRLIKGKAQSAPQKEEVEVDEACWDTHKQEGMKKKNGKMVPNCVPKNEEVVVEGEGIVTPKKDRKPGKPPEGSYAADLAAGKYAKFGFTKSGKETAAKKRERMSELKVIEPKAGTEKEMVKKSYLAQIKDPGDLEKVGPEEVGPKDTKLGQGKRPADRLDNKQKFGEETLDEYQEFKQGGEPLAKKFEKAFAKAGVKTKIKMKTVGNVSVNEEPESFSDKFKKLVSEKKEKEDKEVNGKEKNHKKGEVLSGKKEPIEINPEISEK